MAARLKVKDIEKAEYRYHGARPCINFITRDCNYHIWLQKNKDGFWELDGPIYKKLFVDHRTNKTITLDPSTKANSEVVKYLLEILPTKQIDEHLSEYTKKLNEKKEEDSRKERKNAANEIRKTFFKLSKSEEINCIKIAYTILANVKEDDKLLKFYGKMMKLGL